MTADRREFLKRLAKGVAYAAPTIVSVTAPVHLAGQGKSSQHMGGGNPGKGANLQAPGATPAPWEAPPPGM